MEGLNKLPEDEYPTEVTWTPFQKVEELGEAMKGKTLQQNPANINNFIENQSKITAKLYFFR